MEFYILSDVHCIHFLTQSLQCLGPTLLDCSDERDSVQKGALSGCQQHVDRMMLMIWNSSKNHATHLHLLPFIISDLLWNFPTLTHLFLQSLISFLSYLTSELMCAFVPVAPVSTNKAWLPDGYSQIFRSYVFGPSGFWTMAPLRYAAK